jgi:Holliday junction resolvase RusA-like endonuclease
MFKMRTNIPPKSAKRPTFVPKFGRVVTPADYQQNKKKLIAEFNKYADDENLKDVLFNAKYGISIKARYYFDRKNSKTIFHRARPDNDNLIKATIDALYESKVNQKLVGYITDDDGNQIPKYKQISDDSNVVHYDVLKLNVDPEEIGQEVTLSKILEEDLEE